MYFLRELSGGREMTLSVAVLKLSCHRNNLLYGVLIAWLQTFISSQRVVHYDQL